MTESNETHGHIIWQDHLEPDGPAAIVFEGDQAPYMVLPDIEGVDAVPGHIIICIAAWLKLHQATDSGNLLLEGVKEYLQTIEEVLKEGYMGGLQ